MSTVGSVSSLNFSLFVALYTLHFQLPPCPKKKKNPEMQTMLLNTYPPKLIATILNALREQLIESDQLHSVEEIAGPVPEIPLEYDQILKEGSKFSDGVNSGYL